MSGFSQKFQSNVAPSKPVACLALDIGGVFHADVWETVFEQGLANACGLTMAEVLRQGGPIWDAHAYRDSTEDAFWQSWEQALDRPLSRGYIAQLVADHVWHDPSIMKVAEQCRAANVDLCFVSNSTTFWFERQLQVTGLDQWPGDIGLYMSHQLGYPKTHPEGGLFKLAKDRDPAGILFVDDRKGNTDKAAELGMQSLLYTRQRGVTLAQALEADGRLPVVTVSPSVQVTPSPRNG